MPISSTWKKTSIRFSMAGNMPPDINPCKTERENMNRRNFILTSCAALTATSFAAAPAKNDRPNFILIMADDLGIGDVAGYGFNSEIKTPHLDEMARSGLRFNRFYAQSPVCSPTRFSCMTGRHPFRVGIWEANQGYLRNEEITLPEVLQENGYATGHFGKWHLGRMVDDPKLGKGARMPYANPADNGADEWFAVHDAPPTFNPYGPNGELAEESDNPYYHNGERVLDNVAGDTSRMIMDRAIPFIRKAVKEDKPFFTFIWFNTPHAEVEADPKYASMFSSKKWKYYGAVADMDIQIGRLRKELRNLGIAENTMIWFSSDNGPTGQGSAGPYYAGKRHLFEGGIRVPGLVEWPGKVKAGSTTDAIGCSSDYFQTVLDAAGIDYKNTYPLDGINLIPLLEGKMTERPGHLCFQSHGVSVIMNQKFKAMKVLPGAFSQSAAERRGFPLEEWFLFDMQTDCKEENNVAAQHPEVLRQLMIDYEAWNDSCRASYEGKDYPKPFDPNGEYRENAGLAAKKGSSNEGESQKDKSAKREKRAAKKNMPE